MGKMGERAFPSEITTSAKAWRVERAWIWKISVARSNLGRWIKASVGNYQGPDFTWLWQECALYQRATRSHGRVLSREMKWSGKQIDSFIP